MILQERWNNDMPPWLNVAWGIGIMGAFAYGLYAFGNTTFDVSQGWVNFKDFFIPGIALLGYLLHLSVSNFFASANLAAMMVVILLFLSFILIVSSLFMTDHKNEAKLFEFGLAIGGLALGIPFGEKLRNEENKRRRATVKKQVTESPNK